MSGGHRPTEGQWLRPHSVSMTAIILVLLMVNVFLLYQIQSGHFLEPCQRLFMIRNLHVVIELSVDDRLKVAEHI